jgi:DNA (cytosine-5)-methyltransferase 1
MIPNLQKPPRLTVGSLFSGIGGFDLAAERVGWEIKWQVEIDPYCTKVLEKHWPHVRRYGDIKRLRYPSRVDVICGGFPCQDISQAGKRAGIDGTRSGLWREMARIVRAVRPRYVVVENVSALLARGLGRVLGDLAACGYDAEWDCIPAFAVGAPHRRDRVFLVAYPAERRVETQRLPAKRRSDLPDADGGDSIIAMEHAKCRRLQGGILGCAEPPAALTEPRRCARFGRHVGASWHPEPDVDLLDDGLSSRLAECVSRAIGNSIVPQAAEYIFRQIQAYDESLIHAN